MLGRPTRGKPSRTATSSYSSSLSDACRKGAYRLAVRRKVERESVAFAPSGLTCVTPWMSGKYGWPERSREGKWQQSDAACDPKGSIFGLGLG